MKSGWLLPALVLLTACGQSQPAAVTAAADAAQTACGEVEGATTALTASPVPAACVAKSWLAGSTELCNGRSIYRDYIYDDYGANDGSDTAGSNNKSAGDDLYPAGQVNTADLVDLQLWVADGRLHVRAQLNTLFDANSTQLAVAIDTDDDRATGGGPWCALNVASRGWDVLQIFRGGDVEANVIEGSLPLPPGEHWRVQAVTAQANGTVMNVAYRGTHEAANCGMVQVESEGCWFEDKQAAALLEGDITGFSETISVADLRGGTSRAATSLTPGLHERVYVSDYTLPPGEGIGRVPGRGDGGSAPYGAQFFDYLGKYQPYGIYVASTATPPYVLQLVYHGSGWNLTSLIAQPGMQQAFGEGLGRILAVPLARGPDGYGSDISERDLLDVQDDLETTYDIDRDRVIASGYSQGGYLAYRMASLYPHRYAGFVSWVGFTGNVLDGSQQSQAELSAASVGNMRDFVGNLRNIPGVMLYAGEDEFVPTNTAVDIEQAFAATDNIYTWYMHPGAEHLTFSTLDQWDKEAAYSKDFRRAVNPARVTFRHDPTLGSPEYGVAHDRAYWVSGVTNRRVGESFKDRVYGDIDLINHGCGGSVPIGRTAHMTGDGPVPWASNERVHDGDAPIAAENFIEGSLTNIAALTIDTAATCNPGPLRYSLATDGPATVSFSDGRRLDLPAAGTFTGTLN